MGRDWGTGEGLGVGLGVGVGVAGGVGSAGEGNTIAEGTTEAAGTGVGSWVMAIASPAGGISDSWGSWRAGKASKTACNPTAK